MISRDFDCNKGGIQLSSREKRMELPIVGCMMFRCVGCMMFGCVGCVMFGCVVHDVRVCWVHDVQVCSRECMMFTRRTLCGSRARFWCHSATGSSCRCCRAPVGSRFQNREERVHNALPARYAAADKGVPVCVCVCVCVYVCVCVCVFYLELHK